IGRAMALLFAKEGAKISIVDIDSEKGAETENLIRKEGNEAFFIQADVSKESDVKKAVEITVERFNKLNILCNNAGISYSCPLIKMDEEAWNKVLNINLKGVFLCSKHAIPEMMKTGGSVVNIASVAGIVGLANESAYCASKGGIISLTKAMALELAPHKIRVNCICPGSTLTPMFNRVLMGTGDYEMALKKNMERIPLARIGKPEDIAYAALYLASEESSYVTGAILVVDGGWTSY
ncbi:MAG: SDR family NAD(P)-dependent oxidoreductase, partial [Candidatus Bathyarchaeia archaeon]